MEKGAHPPATRRPGQGLFSFISSGPVRQAVPAI